MKPVWTLADLHSSCIFPSRVKRLSSALTRQLPESGTILDIGTGDGSILALCCQLKPGLTPSAVDIAPRLHCSVPVTAYDGRTLPYGDESFDVVMMVDMLHHSENPARVIREACRVSRGVVIIKDHCCQTAWDWLTLSAMDIAGNLHHGIPLPLWYWAPEDWETARPAGWHLDNQEKAPKIYPWWLAWIFGRSLHIITVWHKDL